MPTLMNFLSRRAKGAEVNSSSRSCCSSGPQPPKPAGAQQRRRRGRGRGRGAGGRPGEQERRAGAPPAASANPTIHVPAAWQWIAARSAQHRAAHRPALRSAGSAACAAGQPPSSRRRCPPCRWAPGSSSSRASPGSAQLAGWSNCSSEPASHPRISARTLGGCCTHLAAAQRVARVLRPGRPADGLCHRLFEEVLRPGWLMWVVVSGVAVSGGEWWWWW
jgi:hypothetical protein